MASDSIFLIDIDKILKEKAGKKARRIPRFFVSYLKHIVHQEEINAFLKSVRDKSGVDFLAACMDFLDAKLDVHGLENLPEDGLCTFVSNHPLGGQDGVALGYLLGTHYNGRIKYLVNDLLMNLHGLAPLCIPINKTGSQSRDFPRMVEEGFRSDSHIIMFPAGICSRRQHGVIKDLAWKKTFITKSVETQRYVVPIHFEGRNSEWTGKQYVSAWKDHCIEPCFYIWYICNCGQCGFQYYCFFSGSSGNGHRTGSDDGYCQMCGCRRL